MRARRIATDNASGEIKNCFRGCLSVYGLDFPIIFFSDAHVKMRPFSLYCGLWQKARMREACFKHLLACTGRSLYGKST